MRLVSINTESRIDTLDDTYLDLSISSRCARLIKHGRLSTALETGLFRQTTMGFRYEVCHLAWSLFTDVLKRSSLAINF